METTKKAKSKLSDDDVRRIVKAEIAQSKWDEYIWSVLTKSDFDTRIRNIITDKLPGSVNKEVRDYLRDNLKEKVQSHLLDMLPRLVETEVLKRLRQDSGLSQTLQQYTQAINNDLSAMRQTFANELATRLSEIHSLRDGELTLYRQQAQAISQEIVNSLVGSNGAVLTGFKNELARSLDQRFTDLKTNAEQRLYALEVRNASLETSLSNQTWINVILGVGLVGVGVLLALPHLH